MCRTRKLRSGSASEATLDSRQLEHIDDKTDELAYYRSIANKAMPILPYHDSKHPCWANRSVATNPHLREEIQQAHKDYAVVRDRMKRRFLIPSKTNPWREVGVLWRAEGSSETVLFAYAPFQWQTGRAGSVMDVTAGAPVATSQGLLATVARHTYLCRSP